MESVMEIGIELPWIGSNLLENLEIKLTILVAEFFNLDRDRRLANSSISIFFFFLSQLMPYHITWNPYERIPMLYTPHKQSTPSEADLCCILYLVS